MFLQTGDGSEGSNKGRSTSAFSMHLLIKKIVIIPSIKLVSFCERLLTISGFHEGMTLNVFFSS